MPRRSYSSSRSRSRSRGRNRRKSRSSSRGRNKRRSRSHSRGGDRNKRRDNYGRRGDNRNNGRNRGRDFGRRNDRRNGGRRNDRQGGWRRNDRRRGRSGSREEIDNAVDPFRHRELSLEKPTEDTETATLKLEEEEVAYVFGRMGSTKDKLGRVTGTNIELRGNGLLIEGSERGVDRAKKYVKILLAQRHGVVEIDVDEHPDDLTLLQVPTDCKGFITGRRGATLRQIEKECATLMTFCKTEADNEPLAIFGTRRGRLNAVLKVMSIVEGKHDGWFTNNDHEEHPKVDLLDTDVADGDWGVTWVKLESKMIGYALGKRGETRMKLQVASGCVMQYIGMWAAFGGREAEQERGKTYLKWLLEQQYGDITVSIRGRTDVKILWVPESSVGYVTGKKANTLRSLETKSGTFCFFDKRRGGRAKEKMLIFSWSEEYRQAAAEEVYLIVDFHQRKVHGNEKCSDHFSGASDSESRSGSRSKSRSHSKPRSSRSRSRSSRMSRSPSRSPSPKRRSAKREVPN